MFNKHVLYTLISFGFKLPMRECVLKCSKISQHISLQGVPVEFWMFAHFALLCLHSFLHLGLFCGPCNESCLAAPSTAVLRVQHSRVSCMAQHSTMHPQQSRSGWIVRARASMYRPSTILHINRPGGVRPPRENEQ